MCNVRLIAGLSMFTISSKVITFTQLSYVLKLFKTSSIFLIIILLSIILTTETRNVPGSHRWSLLRCQSTPRGTNWTPCICIVLCVLWSHMGSTRIHNINYTPHTCMETKCENLLTPSLVWPNISPLIWCLETFSYLIYCKTKLHHSDMIIFTL